MTREPNPEECDATKAKSMRYSWPPHQKTLPFKGYITGYSPYLCCPDFFKPFGNILSCLKTSLENN